MHKGRVLPEEHRRKISAALKGHTFSEESRQKMSSAAKGHKHSQNTKRKMSEAHKGHKHGPPSKAHRRKLSDASKATWADPEYRASRSGENHHQWRGGISRHPYPPEFSEDLKHSARERDGFTCLLCGVGENGAVHDVHHINRDKYNNDLPNLISLCRSCHMKAHRSFDYYRIGFEVLAQGRVHASI